MRDTVVFCLQNLNSSDVLIKTLCIITLLAFKSAMSDTNHQCTLNLAPLKCSHLNSDFLNLYMTAVNTEVMSYLRFNATVLIHIFKQLHLFFVRNALYQSMYLSVSVT